MEKHNSPLEQNISVWARRLGVEIKNMANASTFANRLCGGAAGRHGAITVVVMVPVSKLLDRSMGDTAVVASAVAIATVIYDVIYKGSVDNIHSAFLEEISKSVLGAPDVVAVLSVQSEMIALISKGIAARNGDHSRPSIVNAVLGKARRKVVIEGKDDDNAYM